MKKILATFLRGLSVVLPLALTVWLMIWLATGTEQLLHRAMLLVLPPGFYFPGLGILLGLLLIYGAGLLMQIFFVERLWSWFESLLERIPLIKTVYNAISDFFSFFSSGVSDQASRVASVEVGAGLRLIGLVTDDKVKGLLPDQSDLIAVYLPMSYQVGGYTVLLPAERVQFLDMGVEEAMRYILTAGIQRESRKN